MRKQVSCSPHPAKSRLNITLGGRIRGLFSARNKTDTEKSMQRASFSPRVLYLQVSVEAEMRQSKNDAMWAMFLAAHDSGS